jgi:type I restriction enzyme, S subunit
VTEYTPRTLASVCESVRYGYTASASLDVVGPRFLRITDIVPESIGWDSVPFCEIGDSDKERFGLDPGDIVVARTGATVGYAKLIRDQVDAVFASYLVRFRVDPEIADPGFVGRLVESSLYKDFVKSRVGGAAQPNANAQVLGSFEFRLPLRPVQERIADFLSAYDELIENNRRRMELLEDAARQLYREWFVRLRFPGYEHTPIINGIPEGWERRRIGDIADCIGGGTPSTSVSAYWEDGDIMWVTPTDVTRNKHLVLLDSEKKITEDGLKNSSAKLVPPQAVLMTSRASVGFFAVADREVCTNQGFISIVPHDATFGSYLLFHLSERVEEIRAMGSGSTYPEVSRGKFREFEVLVPTMTLVSLFVEQADVLLRQFRALKQQTQKLRAARDLLLPPLMSGQITV